MYDFEPCRNCAITIWCRAAWKNLEELPAREAKLEYVALANRLLPRNQGVEKEKGAEVIGPVVSTMGQETLEGEALPVRN